MSLRHDLRVVRALAVKDLRLSLIDRVFTVIGVVIPINFLLLFMLFALSGGQAPTAVVLEDQGPLAQKFVDAMDRAHSFIITRTDAASAENLIQTGKIVAVVTVPSGFDADLRAGRRVELPVQINNLEQDFTNDIRRAVPLSVTSFYSETFPEQVVIRAAEVDVQSHDTGYIPYLAVSVVVLGLMMEGLLQAGVNAAREYEEGTITELMLSPASRWAISAGKILGALVLNAIAAIAVLLVVVVVLAVIPVHPIEVIGYGVLLMVTFVAIGTLIGTLLRRRQATVPLSFALALPLFFLSGPFGPANWLGPTAGTVALVSPLYYAIGIFQHAFHGYQTTQSSLTTNSAVLVGFAVVAVVATTLILRRTGAAR